MNPLIQLNKATPLFVIALVLTCFALSPQARATCQDGCLTNGNTVLGDDVLIGVTTGTLNTGVGGDALLQNTTGSFNTATGESALVENTTGSSNSAYGFYSLQSNITGSNNTAIGFEALRLNTQGINNTALGYDSLYKCIGNSNTAIGISAGMNIKGGSNDICIGNVGVGAESNTIRIGNDTHKNTYIAGISGVTISGGVGVMIDTSGHLGTVVSSARYKEAIKPMDNASEAILSLKPVTFRYKRELDPDGTPQFGLVAEDVEKINPDLVARDDEGKPYSVRYDAVNAMLLNEFLKEHRTVQEQKATIAQLKQDFAKQQQQIDALTAGLQKVSDQHELARPAPQTVLNNQ